MSWNTGIQGLPTTQDDWMLLGLGGIAGVALEFSSNVATLFGIYYPAVQTSPVQCQQYMAAIIHSGI